jgi:hypothetical protein
MRLAQDHLSKPEAHNSKLCEALLHRDTLALKNLWLKDFTQNGNSNKLISEQNTLPRYTSLKRTIEEFSEINGCIYTSGKEIYQLINVDANSQFKNIDHKPIKRSFFHVWVKAGMGWKLATKTNK